MVPEVLTVLWVSSAQAQGTPQEGQPRVEGMNLSACSVNRLDVSALLSSQSGLLSAKPDCFSLKGQLEGSLIGGKIFTKP